MKKFTRQLLTGVIALGLLAPVATSSLNPIKTTVNAKRHYGWYHGSPNAIRGKWLTGLKPAPYRGSWGKYIKSEAFSNHRGFDLAPRWYSSHKHYKGMGAPDGNWWNPHYHYLGHNKYEIVCGSNAHSLKKQRESGNSTWFVIKKHGHNHISVWEYATGIYHPYMGYFHRIW